MKRTRTHLYLLLLLTSVFYTLPFYSQSSQYALYNYRNDGDFNAWLNLDIDSITYSCIDTLGVEHDDIVVQEVWTPDSLYRIPMEAIDSIGFRAPVIKYKEEVFHITDGHVPYLITADSLSITFSTNMPLSMLPNDGQIVVSDVYDEPLEDGFAGRVIKTETTADAVKIICEDIEMTDIFEQLVLVGKAVSDTTSTERTRFLGLWEDDYEKSGVETFELGTISLSASNIPVSFSYKPVMKLDYLIYIVKNQPSHYKMVTIGEHTFTASVNIEEKEFLDVKETYFPKLCQFSLPRIAGLIKPKLSFGLFFKADGKITLDGSWPITLTSKLGYEKIGENDAMIIRDFDLSGTPDIKFALKGSLAFGLAAQLEAKVLHKKFASIATTVYLGPKISGKFELKASDYDKILNTSPTLYNTLRNVDITTELFLGIDATYTVFKRTSQIVPGKTGWASVVLDKEVKDKAKLGFEWTFWEKKYKLVPAFFTPKIRKYDVNNNTASVDLTIKDYTSEPFIPKDEEDYIDHVNKEKKDGGLFLPVKIGVKIYDDLDNFICEQEAPDWYYSKTYGSTIQFKDLKDIIALPNPQNCYVIKPHVSLLGLGMVAEPYKYFYATNLTTSNLGTVKVGKGTESIVNIWGCSGSYEAIPKDKSIVETKIDGGLLRINGLKLGETTITVKDLETLEQEEIPVEVINRNLALSTYSCKVQKEGTIEIKITKGSGYYIVSNLNHEIATGKLDGETIVITGLEIGTATIQINDIDAEEYVTIAVEVTDEEITPLELSSTFLPLSVGKNGSLEITSGTGNYTAKSDDIDVATVEVSGSEILVTALKAGTATIIVADTETGQTACVEVPITEDEAQGSAYAVYNDGVLSFYCDEYRDRRSGETFNIPSEDEEPTWDEKKTSVNKVIFDSSFAKARPKCTMAWFYYMYNIIEIVGLQYLNTSNVSNMSYMFNYVQLESLDLSSFNTENVTNMSHMFEDCSKLRTIDLSNFKTNKVTNMTAMFMNCRELNSLDLSNFDTRNVTDMSYMFYKCWALTSIDLSGFNTENVMKMNGMFYECSQLTALDLSGFKTEKVTMMSGMFYGCWRIKVLDLSTFNTEQVTDMSAMFDGCESLVTLNLSTFDTKNVTSMGSMFYGCWDLISLDLSNFNTEKVTDMSYMFGYCSKLTSIDLSSFNTRNVTNMELMFDSCEKLPSINLSNFITENVTSMSNMFYGCESLTSLDLSSFNTENVTSMSYMFCGCSSLLSLDLSNFNTEKVTDMSYMFGGDANGSCGNLSSLNISSFNTKNVMHMSGLFYDCCDLISLDLSNFNTENVTSMANMFHGCSSLTSLDLSSFNTEKVTDMSEMFRIYDSQLKTIYVSNRWSINNVEKSEMMFDMCSNLVGGKGTVYDENHIDGEYARIDGGSEMPGYFTDINAEDVSVVDLGLPSGTRWASCNIGATKPEEVGGLYAWGETEDKSDYTEENYLYNGKDLGSDISGTKYDVAHVKLGGNWQMPTRKQIEELMNKCTHEAVKMNGVPGLKFTGPNGNTIFMPFVEIDEEWGSYGSYWAATSNVSNMNNAYDIFIDDGGSVSCLDSYRYMGRAVRPVETSFYIPPSITITPEDEVNFGVVKSGTDKTETFTVTNTGTTDLKFHVDGSSKFTNYFEVSDNQTSYTLAPGESKKYTVTAHGISAGYQTTTIIFVKSDNSEEDAKIKMTAYGDDDEPLIDKTSLDLVVGEKGSIKVKTSHYSTEADDYDVVDYIGGGPGEQMSNGDGYESYILFSQSGLTFTALKAGVVHITFTDIYSGKTEVLTITVTGNTAGPGSTTISGGDEV